MIPIDYKGFVITNTKGHGKNGKGNRKTMSIEIREEAGEGYLVKKHFSVPIHDTDKINAAILKCKKLIDEGKITKLFLK